MFMGDVPNIEKINDVIDSWNLGKKFSSMNVIDHILNIS